MTKRPKAKQEAPNIELRSDGWERFEAAVDAATTRQTSVHAAPVPKTGKRMRVTLTASGTGFSRSAQTR